MKIHHRKAPAFLALGLVLAAPGWSDPVTVTVEEAVRTASERNLSLQRTSWDLDTKKRQSDNAWNVFLPSAGVSTSFGLPNQQQDPLTGNTVSSQWNLTGSLGVTLSVSGNILASLKALALNYRQGLVTYDLAKKSLEKNVRLVYYSLLLEKENLKLKQDAIDRQAQNLAQVQANYQAGLVPDLDVMTAQVSLEQLKPQQQQLETSFLNDVGQFKVLLGYPLDREIQLSGTLSSSIEKTLDLGTLSPAGRESPDVQVAQLSLDAQNLSKESADLNSWFPTVSLGWSKVPYWADIAGAPGTSMENGSFSVKFSYALDSLIPWSQSRETISQAEDAVRKARSQLEETKTNSILNRQNDIRRISQAVQSLGSLEMNVVLAQKTYERNLEAYNRGTKDLLSLETSEGDLNQARYNVLSQRYTLLSTILDLEYELNVPFGTLSGGNQ